MCIKMAHLITSTGFAILGEFSQPPLSLKPTIEFQNYGQRLGVATFELIQNNVVVQSVNLQIPPQTASEANQFEIPYQDKVKMDRKLTVGCRVNERTQGFDSGPSLLVVHHNNIDGWKVPPVSEKLTGYSK